MYKSFIAHMKDRWIKHGPYEPPLVGCTDEELKAIQRAQQVEFLPALYVEFMKVFGKESGGLVHDGAFRFPLVIEFKNEMEVYDLPDDAFVFLTGQDYSGLYFLTAQQLDDPMIHLLLEGVSEEDEPWIIQKDFCKFSEFLVGLLEGNIEDYQEWG